MRQDPTGPDELRGVISDWARRQATPGDALCPDAEILAAFGEGSLTEAMHGTMTSHLATCPSCQLAVAAMARMESSALDEEAAAAASVSARRHWWRWLAPAVAAASAFLVWVVVDQPAVQENLQDATASTTASQPERLATSPTPAEPASPPTPGVPAATAAPAVERQASPTVEPRAERPGAVAGNVTAPPAGTVTKPDGRAPQDLQIASAATPAAQEPATPPASEPAAKPDAAESSRDASAVAPGPRPQQAFVTEADRTAGRAGPVRTGADRPVSAAETAADQRTNAVGKLAAAAPPQRMRAVKEFEVSAPDGQRRWRMTANGVLVTRDGGQMWNEEPALRGRDFREGSATSDGACWLVGEAGLVMRFTSERGWHAVTRPAETDIVSVGAFTATNAVVETEGGLRYVTSDGGQSWRVNP